MDYNKQRRRKGLILGLALGVGYSVSANLINHLVLPGIPLYVPPPGEFGIVILTTLMFGLLGLIAAWTDEALPGALVSGLAGSILSSIWIVIHETANRGGALLLLFVVFLPRVFFYLPFGAWTRWLVEKLDQPSLRPVAPVRKLFPIFFSFIGVVALGTLSMYPQETRISLIRMDELLKSNAQVTSRADLPKSLRSVEGFVQHARGKYAFAIGSDPDVLPVQRPAVEYGIPEPFIIVRYENGFRFGCIFFPPYVMPVCVDF